MIKLSIIIPVYNTENYVKKCILSCLSQNIDKNEYELIIINDGSTDNSLAILEELRLLSNNIQVVSQNNLGLSGARNTGLRHAKGEYVWFVDSDDWIESNCLNRIIGICEDYNLDMLRLCAADVYPDKTIRRFSYFNNELVSVGKDALNKEIPFCSTFNVYNRHFLKEHNLWFYVGVFHEDNEFTPRAFYYAKRVMSLNDIVYYVYQNPNSITRTVNPKKVYDCILVMNRLEDFMVYLSPSEKRSFDYQIAITFNAALHNTYGITNENVKKLNIEFYNNRHLFRHFFLSKKFRYFVEGVFFYLFPRNTINVYRFLNKSNNKK